MKIIIVGGVAGGASAAARLRRLDESLEIVLIERGPDVSFANCGLPYFIGGEISDRSRLNVQTPDSLSAMLNIEVKTLTEVTSIDREKKEVVVRDLSSDEESRLSYDRLILAPGAAPLRPPIPGIDHSSIYTLRNLQDMDRIVQAVGNAKEAVIVGAGFIGLEMAEQLVGRGLKVHVVELVEQVLPQMDPEMVRPLEMELADRGVTLRLGDGIDSFESDGDLPVAVLKSGTRLPADLVLLSIGVRPESKLASDAGLDCGKRGHIRVNEHLQTSDPEIYAAGDAVESVDRQTGEPSALPLGGPANRQGRSIGDHIMFGDKARPYPGNLGTAIVRVFDMAAGVTGWTEKRLVQEGKTYRSTTVTDHQHAGYFPGAVPLTVKICWDPESKRLLGGQVVGVDGVDKRVDVLATALAGKLTIDDLAQLELAYAPPFGGARDVINTVGFTAQNITDGLLRPVKSIPDGAQIVDVRPPQLAELDPMPEAISIPFGKVRTDLGQLDKGRPVVTVCALGKTSYFAARILQQAGYDAHSLSGGLKMLRGRTAVPGQPAPGNPQSPVEPSGSDIKKEPDRNLDATGLACPGPLMRMNKELETMSDGEVLEVQASDPGFANDVRAYCERTGNRLVASVKEKGILSAQIEKAGGSLAGVQSASTGKARPEDTTLVVFNGDMDKALGAFVIANGAAAMGGKVTLFFTFWGLNVIRREEAIRVPGKSLMDRMFGLMLPRGPGKLPLSRMNFLGIGAAMMKWHMKNKNLPNLPDMIAQANEAGVRLVACTMSMDAMGIRQEELIDEVELGGAADFLSASSTSGTNLFI